MKQGTPIIISYKKRKGYILIYKNTQGPRDGGYHRQDLEISTTEINDTQTDTIEHIND